MIEIKSLYDALKMFGGADTWDTDFDEVICWELPSKDDDDVCSRCAIEMAKRIDIVRVYQAYHNCWEFVADITKFVKEHIKFMYELSQGFKWPMESADPNDDDSVYTGVQIVNAMQAGYACDEQYEAMLSELLKPF